MRPTTTTWVGRVQLIIQVIAEMDTGPRRKLTEAEHALVMACALVADRAVRVEHAGANDQPTEKARVAAATRPLWTSVVRSAVYFTDIGTDDDRKFARSQIRLSAIAADRVVK